MRKINSIIIHCSATPKKMDIGAKTIKKWHVSERGFSDIGYHFVIRRNGKLETGRPIAKAGAHCKGKNRNSIGICLIGGVDTKNKPQNNFLKAQFETLESIINDLEDIHGALDIHGHNEFSKKACPSFNVKDWLKSIEVETVVEEPVVIKKKSWWRFW